MKNLSLKSLAKYLNTTVVFIFCKMAYKIINKKMYDCICERCRHKWMAKALPNACAKCKSTAWNNVQKILKGGKRQDD